MRRPGDYDGPVDYRCLRPVQCASGTHALTIQCQGLMRLVDGCAEPVLLCDLCGRVAALEPTTPTTVHYRGVEYEVLTDALVDGAWWLVLFELVGPSTYVAPSSTASTSVPAFTRPPSLARGRHHRSAPFVGVATAVTLRLGASSTVTLERAAGATSLLTQTFDIGRVIKRDSTSPGAYA